jgi:hypothetical protein
LDRRSAVVSVPCSPDAADAISDDAISDGAICQRPDAISADVVTDAAPDIADITTMGDAADIANVVARPPIK